MKNSKNKVIIYISILTLMVLNAVTLKAQDPKAEFGVRFMPTVSSFNVQTSSGNTITGKAVVGYGFGAILGIKIANHVGIQGELIYNSISQKYSDNNTEHNINLRYFNVPVLLSLNTGKMNPVNLNVVVGPQLGFNAGSSITSSGGDGSGSQPVLSVKKGDVGFAYGAGLDFGLNKSKTVRLGFGFRGVYGLVDISNHSTSSTTNDYYVLDRTHIKTYSAYGGLSVLF